MAATLGLNRVCDASRLCRLAAFWYRFLFTAGSRTDGERPVSDSGDAATSTALLWEVTDASLPHKDVALLPRRDGPLELGRLVMQLGGCVTRVNAASAIAWATPAAPDLTFRSAERYIWL